MTRTRPNVHIALRDLNDAVAKAHNTVHDLHPGSPPESFDLAADELHAALTIARDLARPASVTGCAQHPQGAVDESRPEWGRCLICNTRRRRALPQTLR